MKSKVESKRRATFLMQAIMEELERMDERICALEDMHRVKNQGSATLCANQVSPPNGKPRSK